MHDPAVDICDVHERVFEDPVSEERFTRAVAAAKARQGAFAWSAPGLRGAPAVESIDPPVAPPPEAVAATDHAPHVPEDDHQRPRSLRRTLRRLGTTVGRLAQLAVLPVTVLATRRVTWSPSSLTSTSAR